MSKDKSDKHMDRVVRFRATLDIPKPVPPSDPSTQTIQELIMVPLFFSFPEGGSVA